jgi:hypothetical protein
MQTLDPMHLIETPEYSSSSRSCHSGSSRNSHQKKRNQSTKKRLTRASMRIPDLTMNKVDSFDNLSQEAMQHYLQNKIKVKKRIEKIMDPQEKNPNMKSRMLIFKDTYSSLAIDASHKTS